MQESPRSNAGGWKILLALLLIVAGIGMGTTLYLSMQRASRVADPDYYSHGLNYGKTASGLKNPGMSWRMATSVAGNQLQVRVRDQSGTPVLGGELRFEPERLGVADGPAFTMAESSPGTFQLQRPETPEGELHGTLRFTRGEAVATQKLVLFD
jgi:hypothetical protein